MAIGAHELLLIVRGQNQASAMLGRVGRDIRRLQAQRDLSVMRAQQMNRLSGLQIRQAQQLARIESTFEEQGKVRLQYQIQAQRNALHQLNIQNRIANLEIRRTAIERAGANLAVQRLRLLQQQASVESNLEKIELRRQGINNQIGRIGTSVLRNGVQQAELRRRQYSLETQFMERQLALSKATAAVTAARRDPKTGRYAAVPEELVTQEEIRRRRVHETELALAEIPGRSRVLESSLQDLRANVTRLQYSLQGLKAEEVRAAESAGILAKRIQALSAQEANLVARTAAVSGANAELNLQLEITQKELEKLTAAWRAEIASGQAAVAQWELATKQIAMMNAEIAQTDAAMARIGPERMATIARGISHLGRVMQTAGLIGVAALGAMAVSAAHFNTEAIRVSTQTGNVFTSTGQTVVANSEKISKAVTDAMQTIPANQHDLTDALYTIYSTTDATLGQGAKLVKLFGDAWVAGGMIGNVNDVSQALVTLANNWDINTGNMAEFRKLAASTLATVRFGGLTLEQYTQTMNQLAPAFKTAHQSIEQMNGAIAFMTRLLPSQRMSAAGLARLMDIIGRFAAHPASGFEKLAKSIVDVNGNLIPLDQIINKFIQTSRAMGTDITKNGVALNQWLKTISNQEGTVQARRALQALVQQYGLYTNILRKTSGDRKEFTRDLQAMRQSTGYKWDVFVNQMRALGLELGAVVVPALMKLVAPLQHLAKWFNGLSDAQKKSYGEWATWIAAATLAIGVIASVAGALAATIISLKMIRNSFTVLGGEAGFLSVRLGLVLGALALLIPILHSFGINLSDILNVLTGSGGLIGAIKLLGVVITALTFGKLIKALATTALGMDAATRATNRFGKALLLLSTMSLGEAIIAGVGGYSLAKFIDNLDTAALPGKGMGEAFREGGPGPGLYNITHRTKPDIAASVKNINKVRDQIRKEAQDQADTGWNLWDFVTGGPGKTHVIPDQALFQSDLDAIQRQVAAWRSNKLFRKMPMSEKVAAIKDFMPELDTNTIEMMLKMATRRIIRARQNFSRSIGYVEREDPVGHAVRSAATQFTTPEFLSSVRQAAKLQQAMADPSQSLEQARKSWLAYHNYVAKITNDMTKQQKKMFDDLVNFFASMKPPTVSIQNAIPIVREMNRLLLVAQQAPDTATAEAAWKAYFDYVSKNASKMSDDVKQAAQSIVENIPTVSDATAVAMQRNVNALEQTFNRTHSIADYNAWQAAITAMNNVVIDKQQQMAQAVTSADKQIAIVSDQTAIAMQRHVNTLEQVFNRTHALQAYREWQTALANLNNTLTDSQQQMAQAVTDSDIQIAKITTAAVIDMVRKAAIMQAAFEKTPSLANWVRWQALLKQITALGTQTQIDAANAVTDQEQQNLNARTQAAKEAAEKRKQIEEQAYQEALQRQQQAQQDIKTMTQNLMNIYDTALSQYQGYLGTIFSGPFMQSAEMQNRSKYGFGARPQDLVKDMEQSVTHAENFQKSLDALRARGAPQELIQQIAALGPEAQEQLDVVSRMSSGEFKKWVAYFKRGQAEAKVQAQKELDRRLAEWEKFGKDVAAAIAKGISSENYVIETNIKSLVEQIFPGIAAIAGTAPVKPGDTGTGPVPQDSRAGAVVKLSGAALQHAMDAGSTAASTPGYTEIGRDETLSLAEIKRLYIENLPELMMMPHQGKGGPMAPWTHGETAADIAEKTGLPIAKATQALKIASGNWLQLPSLILDMMQETKNTTKKIKAVGDGYAGRLQTQQKNYYNDATSSRNAGTTNNVTYNIHPTQQGEGLESMLRRSHFYYRNRKNNL